MLEQREGFQVVQLRLGSQKAPKVEEIVLQPFEPSRKKIRVGQKLEKEILPSLLRWLKLSTKGVFSSVPTWYL